MQNSVSILEGPVKYLGELSQISFKFSHLRKVIDDSWRNEELGGVVFEFSVPGGDDSFAILDDLLREMIVERDFVVLLMIDEGR